MNHFSPYTDDPSEGSFVVFPSHAHQILSSFIQILGASLLAYCFARRTDSENLGSRSGWANLTWAKLCVILLFLDSWIFLVFSGILISGIGLSFSVPVCSLGVYACIVFYAASKALIYLFLVERVWIVWNAGNSLTRRQSFVYKALLLVIMGYIVIFILLIVGRIALIRTDGACVIGLRSFASLPLLSYDLFVNVLLTSMFIWPLKRDRHTNQRLRLLAWRTLAAAAVALTTSSVNIAILAVVGGKQLGWVCLGSCATDVTVNALVIFWVTAGAHRDAHDKIPQRPANGRKIRIAAGTLSMTIPQLDVAPSFVRQEDGITFANGDTLDLESGMGRCVDEDGYELDDEEDEMCEEVIISKEYDSDSIVDLESGKPSKKESGHEARVEAVASADVGRQYAPRPGRQRSGSAAGHTHSPASSRSRFSIGLSSLLRLGSRSSTSSRLASAPNSPASADAPGQLPSASHPPTTRPSALAHSTGGPSTGMSEETPASDHARRSTKDTIRKELRIVPAKPERALTLPSNLHASSSSSSSSLPNGIPSASPSLTTTLHPSPSDQLWHTVSRADERPEAGPSSLRVRDSSIRSSRHLRVLRWQQHERSRSSPQVTSVNASPLDGVLASSTTDSCPFCAKNVPGRPADWQCPHGMSDEHVDSSSALSSPDGRGGASTFPLPRPRLESIRKAKSCPKSLRTSHSNPGDEGEELKAGSNAQTARSDENVTSTSRPNHLTLQIPSSYSSNHTFGPLDPLYPQQ
ncbi:hypothetical protein SCHPADRAFT_939215 [Schizopora paradoxa]|uniref:Transmembrane protein n=1 Tax=Schizopora paradoxa TaxID=27342 RepID=A0A0H2RT51_9AGAM|nr:hypothetical protein SCHPADRAFT_939215 [Schizopora paradoxa]